MDAARAEQLFYNEDARKIVEPHLDVGERLIWYYCPKHASKFWEYFRFLLFVPLWAVAWLLIVRLDLELAGTRPGYAMSVIGIVVSILLGIFMVADGNHTMRWIRNRAYGLTAKRVIIVRRDTGAVESFTGEAFKRMEVAGNAAIGTVRFDYRKNEDGYTVAHEALRDIRFPHRVQDLIAEHLLNTSPESVAGAPPTT